MPKQKTMWFYEDCVIQVREEDVPAVSGTPKPALLTFDLKIGVT